MDCKLKAPFGAHQIPLLVDSEHPHHLKLLEELDEKL